MTQCNGMNCGTTTGNHSPECRAEHAAAVAGGRFVKGDAEPKSAIFVDLKKVARLMIKHGGHVDSEGWVLNQSGLHDFLHEYLREPGTPTVDPVAWRHSHTHCLFEEKDEVPLADGDEWAEPLYTAPPAASGQKLTDIEQYRMQMAGISTAALGYWKEGDEVHADYDTLALRDVAKLYAKYAAFRETLASLAACVGMLMPNCQWTAHKEARALLALAASEPKKD